MTNLSCRSSRRLQSTGKIFPSTRRVIYPPPFDCSLHIPPPRTGLPEARRTAQNAHCTSTEKNELRSAGQHAHHLLCVCAHGRPGHIPTFRSGIYDLMRIGRTRLRNPRMHSSPLSLPPSPHSSLLHSAHLYSLIYTLHSQCQQRVVLLHHGLVVYYRACSLTSPSNFCFVMLIMKIAKLSWDVYFHWLLDCCVCS